MSLKASRQCRYCHEAQQYPSWLKRHEEICEKRPKAVPRVPIPPAPTAPTASPPKSDRKDEVPSDPKGAKGAKRKPVDAEDETDLRLEEYLKAQEEAVFRKRRRLDAVEARLEEIRKQSQEQDSRAMKLLAAASAVARMTDD
jgi:hypothetical protein